MSKKSNWGRILLSGASLAAMGAFASPALAQDEADDEIVVTATGRAAAIQDVPVAVTALSGDQMEASGVEDLRDLTQLAPSFSMDTGQSLASTTARVRGIGTGGDNVGFEAAVGIFIDGVYRARAGAALSDLPELERVEVLRGPQGTLFGRNTSAGALSVVTVGPGWEPGMSIEAEAGLDDLESTAASAMVNLPVSDSLAFRFDGSVRSRLGYITDVISGDDINDVNRWTARGQAQWDISPDASLRVIVDGSESDEVCCGVTPLIYGSTNAAVAGISLAVIGNSGSPAINLDDRFMSVTPALPGLPAGTTFIAGLPSGGGGFGVTGLQSFPVQPGGPARNYGDDSTDFGVSAQLDWDIGGIALTSITAMRDWEQTRNQDVDFHSADIASRYGDVVGANTFTQELRFNGEAGRLNWLAGVFYSDEQTTNESNIQVGAHATAFVNLNAIGATRDINPDPLVVTPLLATAPLGCELYDSTAGDVDGVSDPIPSLFYCATGGLALANAYLAGNVNGQGQQRDRWETNTQSISVFTHNEIALSDQLTWTIGARYTQEDKEIEANLFSTSASCDALRLVETLSDPGVPGPGGIVNSLQVSALNPLMNLACNPAVNPISNGNWQGDQEEQEWSGTTSLAYNLNDDVMIYGGYSRGYKAGGFNMDRQGFAVTPALTSNASLSIYQTQFDPEFTDAYEIGIKSTIFGGTTTFNVSGFYQQIHDYQLNAYNGFNFITQNVSELVSQGVELEVTSRPIDGLFLTGGVTWNDVYYDSNESFNPLTLAANCVGGVPCSADPNSIVAGDPLSFAPEWTVTGGVSYTVPVGDALQAVFYLDGRWNSEHRTQTLGRDPLGRTDNEAFAIFNGRISLGSQNERWALEFWGQNLTDELYYVGSFSPPLQNTFVVYPNMPATYGVTMRLQY